MIRTLFFAAGFAMAMSFSACSMHPSLAGKPNIVTAAEKGDLETVRALIHQGVDVNVKDGEGWTPYLAASTNGHLEIMDLLVRNGARKVEKWDGK